MNLIETLEHHRDLDKLFSSHASPHLMSLAERQVHMKNLEGRTKTPGVILEDTQAEVAILLMELDTWKKTQRKYITRGRVEKIISFLNTL